MLRYKSKMLIGRSHETSPVTLGIMSGEVVGIVPKQVALRLGATIIELLRMCGAIDVG